MNAKSKYDYNSFIAIFLLCVLGIFLSIPINHYSLFLMQKAAFALSIDEAIIFTDADEFIQAVNEARDGDILFVSGEIILSGTVVLKKSIAVKKRIRRNRRFLSSAKPRYTQGGTLQ